MEHMHFELLDNLVRHLCSRNKIIYYGSQHFRDKGPTLKNVPLAFHEMW